MTSQATENSLPTQQGIHRRLVVGWLSKGMGVSITFGEQILLVPVFLILWGPEQYGEWLVLLSTAGFIALLDTGLQTYYANAMQAALSRGKPEVFRRLLHQGTALYSIIIFVALPIVAVAAYQAPWSDLLNLKGTMADTGAKTLMILALYFLVSLPFGMTNAVYRAHGHFATSIMVGNLARLTLISAVAVAVWMGADMVTLGMVYVSAIGASWLAMITHQKRRYPDLQYGVSLPDRTAFKELAAVAPLYAIVPAAMLVTTHATIIMISTLAAAGTAVVMYTTMRTLTGIARMIMDQIMHVTGVEIARQFAENDAKAMATLYAFIGRLAGAVCGTLAGLIAIIGPPFLAIWTVGKVPFDATIFWPLLGAAGLAGPSVTGISVLLFINRPAGMARAYALAGGATLCLCLALIPPLGAAGAAWAVLIAETCVLSILIPIQTAKIIDGSAVGLIARIQGIALVAFVISGAAAWLAQLLTGSDSLLRLALVGVLWAALVSAPLYFLMFSPSRRQWITDRLRNSFGR